MKITVKTTTTKEVDVTFPHYRKSEGENLYVAIFSETKAIKVGYYQNSNDINIVSISPATALSITDVECTKDEFIAHYEKAVAKVNDDFDNLMSGYALEEDSKYDAMGALVDRYESNEEEGQ